MSTAVESAVQGSVPTSDGERQRFRPDIEGLRAVAVLLVLAFHAGLPFVAGGFVGVDVFFVISGFLITGLILREVDTTGRLRLGRFYARRIRRLLPATAVVLCATAALTVAFLPPLRWPTVAGDLVASATYVVNWRLAGESVDYLASEAAPARCSTSGHSRSRNSSTSSGRCSSSRCCGGIGAGAAPGRCGGPCSPDWR